MVMITSRALGKVEPSEISRLLSGDNAASTAARTRRINFVTGGMLRRSNDV
jgi:hypothetical protein